MIGLYYIFFWNKSNMAFFPGAIQGMQVLWQPVVIPNNQNETIELLKKENDRLKAQLEAVLKVAFFLKVGTVNTTHTHIVRSEKRSNRSIFSWTSTTAQLHQTIQ